MKVLSAIQPTGPIHLGNYLGALKHWVALQNEGNECYWSIADLHALTATHNADELRQNTHHAMAAMLAMGFDPKKSTLFVQSHVPAHTELAWILATLTPLGELERMTQFKDKSQQATKAEGINTGLLTYPTLMAADILLYNPEKVPVGDDQIQHLELTRAIARKFNTTYTELFTEPDALIQKDTARLRSLQDPTKKMSKSLGPNHYIGLFENEKDIRDKIQRAVTDSGTDIVWDPDKRPAISNLLAMYAGITDKTVHDAEKEFSGVHYADFKTALADAIVGHLAPMRERYEELIKDEQYLADAFAPGAEKTRTESEEMMQKIRAAIGLRSKNQ